MPVALTDNLIRGLGAPPSWAEDYPAGSSQWFYVNRETGQWNPDGQKEGGPWGRFFKAMDGTWWEEGSWGDEEWRANTEKWRYEERQASEEAPEAVAPTVEEAVAEVMAVAADEAPEMLLLCFIDCSLVHLLMSSGGCI